MARGFVLDASVAISWAAETEAGMPVLERTASDPGHAPMLWWYEVHNALLVKERRRLHTPEAIDAFMALLAGLGITLDTTPERLEVLRIARVHGLSVYDAAYLELAQRQGLPLATLDKALGPGSHRRRRGALACGDTLTRRATPRLRRKHHNGARPWPYPTASPMPRPRMKRRDGPCTRPL